MLMKIKKIHITVLVGCLCTLLSYSTVSLSANSNNIDSLYHDALQAGLEGRTQQGLRSMVDAANVGSFQAAIHLAQIYAFGDKQWNIERSVAHTKVWISMSQSNLKRKENVSYIGSENHLRLLSLNGTYGDDLKTRRQALRQCVNMAKTSKQKDYYRICYALLKKMR